MKRLILPLITAAVCAIAAPVSAQSKDLAGSWTLDVEKSSSKDGPAVLVITLSDTEFTARVGDVKAPAITFKLDGSETAMKDGGKTKASWQGHKLLATVISPRGGVDNITFSRDGDWLVMEGIKPQHGPMKLYFKKTPSQR